MSDQQPSSLLAAAAKAWRQAMAASRALARAGVEVPECEDLLIGLAIHLDDTLHAVGHIRFR